MPQPWRLLKLETHNAAENMAIDEAILRSRMQNRTPNTVRFYCWNPSAVSIGRFQDLPHEVNVENCQKHGVDVVRRITGGGTVYHDRDDEITYSVVVSREDLEAENVTAAYNKICNGLTNALQQLGIKADFNQGDPKNCPNISINGRKISGSAQSFKGGIVLQHGTLLLRVNLQKMFTYIRVPWAKTCMEIVPVAERKITSLEKELGKQIDAEHAYAALVKGFQTALNMTLNEASLTSEERRMAESLRKEKFGNRDWTFAAALSSKP